ncbi:MAG TPA: CBS domain-containing protein [Solirubrobacteraceae bacterium]
MDSSSRTISIDDAEGQLVEDVMISRPKTLPGGALVADVRVQFERPSVRTVLLADDGRFVGAIDRDRLPVDASDQEPATRYLDEQPSTVTPDTTVSAAIELLRERSEPRLIVLDPDGVTLRGLLCVNGTATGFCIR